MTIPGLSWLRSRFSSGNAETVENFLGVVHLDDDVLVVGNHIVAILEVSGTNWFGTSDEGQKGIRNAYLELLNNSELSFQEIVDTRPINWELEFLQGFREAARATAAAGDDWAMDRFEKYERAISRWEIERKLERVVVSSRQYVAIPYYMGRPTYYPPRRGWRFWQRVTDDFNRNNYRAALRRGRRQLADAAARYVSMSARMNMSARRLGALEITQMLHLLWRNEEAYNEWISSEERMREIMLAENEPIPVITGPRAPETLEATS